MTDEAQRWKAKYLQSLEQQEKLERRWEARLDLLRRGLVRSTLAAEGSDKSVDLCMKEMREVIRHDDMDAALARLLPRLEKAVLDSEQRRAAREDQVGSALAQLVSQLQRLPLPGDIARPLKKYAKQLDGRVGQVRELPLLLGELSALQGQALDTVAPGALPRPGLLQRLFGDRETPQGPAAPVQDAVPQAQPGPVDPAPTDGPDRPEPSLLAEPDMLDLTSPAPGIAAIAVQTPAATVQEEPGPAVANAPPGQVQGDARPTAQHGSGEPAEMPGTHAPGSPGDGGQSSDAFDDGPYALPDAVEPPYSSVAAHIEQTLLGLLDELDLPERHEAQALAMRERVARGLNWYELIPVLDDLTVLLLAVNDSGQHEFEAYLQQLNGRLETFQSHLREASSGHADNSSASRELDDQLRRQVDGLQSSVHGAVDLANLKSLLEGRLEDLLGTIDAHQRKRDLREQELAEHLQGLAQRVSHMEQEALEFREHLEEQRQKALLDPLTGLPNRAAWAERLEQEMRAWDGQTGELLIAILDIDHFKRINDSYGHLAGDKVLKIIAGQLRKRLPAQHFMARFGGEEFVLLLPRTSALAALQQLEALRAAVQGCPFHFKGEPVVITVSIGISLLRAGEPAETVLKRADQALYRAKAQGRNRVEACPYLPTPGC